MSSGLVMYEEEYRLIAAICDRLTRDANAKVVFLVDKNGQLIASSGQAQHLDTTSLASLTAGNVAAMGGLAKLIGEKEFPSQFHEGEKEVKKAGEELARVFDALAKKQAAPGAQSPFAEITDDDIDNLFSE
jgi:hypothetical protein